MITRRLIKTMVENVSGIQDISVRNREDEYVQTRWVYFKLCRMFLPAESNSLPKIGQTVDRDHASVLHGLKKFDFFYSKDFFENKRNMYSDVYLRLHEMDQNSSLVENFNNLQDLEQFYRIKHIKLITKSHSVISTLSKKIDLLTQNELIKKILTLDAQEIEELEERLEVFFKVKKALKQVK